MAEVCSLCGQGMGFSEKKRRVISMVLRTGNPTAPRAFFLVCHECAPGVREEWQTRIDQGEECTCKCGKARGPFDWATGEYRPGQGQCESCFRARANAMCEVTPLDVLADIGTDEYDLLAEVASPYGISPAGCREVDLAFERLVIDPRQMLGAQALAKLGVNVEELL